MPPRMPAAPCLGSTANDDGGWATDAYGEWLVSLSDRVEQQTMLLQECLDRLGDTGAASLAQRDDHMLKLLEYLTSRVGEGGGPQATASMWKPKLTGAGMELRANAKKQPPILEVQPRPRSNSIMSNSTPAGTTASDAFAAISPRSIFSDLPAEHPRPQLANAFARSATKGPGSRSGSCSSSGDTLGVKMTPRRQQQRRAAKWRAEVAAIAAANIAIPHARPGALPQVEETAAEGEQLGESERPQRVTQFTIDSNMWSWRRRMWQFVEDKQSSRGAMIYGYISMLAITACVVLSMTDILFPSKAFVSRALLVVEAPFALELIFRYWVCPNRDMFWFDPYNLIDLLAIGASVVPRVVVTALDLEPEVAYSCRIFSPFLFLLRFLRRFEHFQLLASAFAAAAQALPVLLYTCFLIALFHASAIYLLEPREVFPTMRDSLWFTIVTMSTVGYGDISPVTDAGRALTSNLIVLASLYTAIPIGIVGNAFSQVWEERDRLLLLQQLRQRIARAGYTPRDLANMFFAFDEDGNGQLCFEEFRELLPMMHINMPDSVAFRVFETFDDDGEGSVDFEEFLMGIFPAQGYFMSSVRRSATANLPPREVADAGSAQQEER